MATVDDAPIQLRDIRARMAPGTVTAKLVAAAVVQAVVDSLVLRELAALDIHPASGESKPVAVDRLLAEIYAPARHCAGISERDMKTAYIQQMTRFKHPASWTLWTALVQHPDPAKRRAISQAIADIARNRLPPPPELPASTTCLVDDSPVMASHAKPFEAVVAELSDETTAVQLRRYTAYDQDDAEIPGRHFRSTDPIVSAAARALKIGELRGPISAAEGDHVVLLVCRQDRRFDRLQSPAAKRELVQMLCSHAANTARSDYLQRLLGGATIRWQRPLIERAFGAGMAKELPPDVSERSRPKLPL